MACRAASASMLADLCAFLDRGVSPFHATAEAAARLRSAGFAQLNERESTFDVRLMLIVMILLLLFTRCSRGDGT